ncbi:hypothetical protein FGRMN_9407 [Fusarium graminum]|nr:hypothetical protein FGRMN_9407 [Fusarium graminum]
MVPFSWRNEICRFLEVSPDVLDEEILQALGKASKILKEAEQMRARFEARQGPPRYQLIYSSILNFELYLERNKEVVFIIYKNYRCCGNSRSHRPRPRKDEQVKFEASSLLVSEEISIISPDLKSAMADFADSVLGKFPHPDFSDDEEMKYPYIWWFHRRKEIDAALEKHQFALGKLVREYVLGRMAEEWETVDKLLEKKQISLQYMGYLFVPEQMAISTEQGRGISKLQGVVIKDWLDRRPFIDYSAVVSVAYWTFDGTFRKMSREFTITDLPHDMQSETHEFSITDLPLYPMKYASNEVSQALFERGRMFWKCRFRNYVSLSGEISGDIQDSVGSRFMVDIETHKKLHRDGNSRSQRAPSPGPDDLDLKCMNGVSTPMSPFKSGVNLFQVTLDVHYLRDVVWNTEAFDLLVVQEETKLLIQAVVTNQLRSTENADLIRGKGNGLFILLHGGPGTGKTLTAESVAEVAEKPLYRVTCGDIGTKAEDVEQYLNVVLHLGKTWGCVVLLDEADVFLEQRSLVNLERNALVSVFLRVLEYYDGILILTSNRVGIFDEAFKSRIQLNLRYTNLDRGQRLQIWKNFFIRLNRLDQETLSKSQSSPSYGVNMDEITDKLDELAGADLNGRQIRNVISTARQLARYLKEPLGYKHLTAVISEAKKFDDYLLELNRTRQSTTHVESPDDESFESSRSIPTVREYLCYKLNGLTASRYPVPSGWRESVDAETTAGTSAGYEYTETSRLTKSPHSSSVRNDNARSVEDWTSAEADLQHSEPSDEGDEIFEAFGNTTVGDQAQMDDLLAAFGKKLFGSACLELHKHTEDVKPSWKCVNCQQYFETDMELWRHNNYPSPSDPNKGGCRTWNERQAKIGRLEMEILAGWKPVGRPTQTGLENNLHTTLYGTKQFLDREEYVLETKAILGHKESGKETRREISWEDSYVYVSDDSSDLEEYSDDEDVSYG